MIKGLSFFCVIVTVLGGPMTGGHQAKAVEPMENIPEAAAVLVLSDEISGPIFIRDRKDLLVVELNKPCGSTIELGLDMGQYVVVNIWEGDVYESTIALRDGEILELTPAMFMFVAEERDDAPREHVAELPPKDTLLGDRIQVRLTGGLELKSARIFDEYGVLFGGNIGVTLNRNFSIGVAGYSRAAQGPGCFDLDVDFDEGKPSYGGLVLGYAFRPSKKVHFRIGALLGGGSTWERSFAIFEPGVDMVLNITQVLSLRLGVTMPFASPESTGIKDFMLNFGLQFGK